MPSERSTGFFAKPAARAVAWRKNPAVAGVALAAFDDATRFARRAHLGRGKDRLGELDDGLPQYRERFLFEAGAAARQLW